MAETTERLAMAVGPSRMLTGVMVAAHASAAGLLWLLPLPGWLAVVSLPIFAGSLWITLRRDGLRSAMHAIIALELHPDCRCVVQTRRGEWHDAKLLPGSFVSPYLTVLNLRLDGSRWARHVVILPDAVDGESFRRLRVLLRWKCGRGEVAA